MTLIRRYSDNQMPSMFDKFFNNELSSWPDCNYSERNTSLPAVNVKENESEYEIEVAAPGMNRDDFKVNLSNDLLTISSEKKDEAKEDKTDYSRREFSYRSFKRSFTLPKGMVDGEKITASYVDGIINISLPKREEVKPKPAREITIS